MTGLLTRRRSRLVVEIDLDPVPGWGNGPDDHVALLTRLLHNSVPHYNPTVEVALPHVYVVMDIHDRRHGVFTCEEDANAYVEETNAEWGAGWAWYECVELLTEGQRP